MNGNGIRVLSSKWIDSRLLNVTFSSTVLSAPVGVRILIPADYQRQPRLHFPVLYLLHGGGGSYTDWTTAGHAEQLTAGLPLITVMPAGGGGGWYSNWDNFGAGGPPEWETFHIHQLIPWIDANFRTIPNKAGRAIAGLSMGGFGAIDYAARNPELFAVAASFSGADDMNNPGLLSLVQLSPLIDGGPIGSIFGTRLFDNDLATAHNPYTLAKNLVGVHVAIYAGNGSPGPLDPPGTPSYDYNEFAVREMSVALHLELQRLGIPNTFVDYGRGTHTWPYWNRDLQEELPSIMATLSGPQHQTSFGADDITRSTNKTSTPPTDSVESKSPSYRQLITRSPHLEPSSAEAFSHRSKLIGSVPSTLTSLQPPLVGTTSYVTPSGTDNDVCSVRQPCRSPAHAIVIAAPGSEIVLGPGVYKGDMVIDKALVIVGRGRSSILSGDPTSEAATVTVVAGVTTTISDLTVRNPNQFDDGIRSSGNLTLRRVSLIGNGKAGLDVLSGEAVVTGSTFASNGAYGIANDGSLSVAMSTVMGNDYGVANNGSAMLDADTIADNMSGGVLTLLGSMTVDNSTVKRNHGVGVQAFSGITHVLESTITGNGFYGIAAEPTPYSAVPTIDVSASTIYGNSPADLGGGSPILVQKSK